MAGTKRKSKRQLVRDEKRAKEKKAELGIDETKRESKRQRTSKPEDNDGDNEAAFAIDTGSHGPSVPETEFFGMLADEEQEYFKQADELLELNDFPSNEDRDMFLLNVYKEAEGKELKLASSQSCSRLMERLIMLSNTRQKKHLFEQYAGHFISLITHRFASHCVEKLFLVSAPVVTEEMSGVEEPDIFAAPVEKSEGEEEEKPQASMEELFLLTLDELEEHLAYLLSEKFASHALRVLLVILSGRPLDQLDTKSLLQSKAKEHITVAGGLAAVSELASQTRAVPETFTLSIKKIITDCTSTMDTAALRVLSKHPTGNPVLQLLLELDIQLNTKAKSKIAKQKKAEDAEPQPEEEKEISLLERLVPGAPASFNDASSPASEFVNSMLYDPIGSRLLETLITHCPGRIFKGLQANYFGPRIDSLLRNDIASYPAIRVLNRMNKEDLGEAVKKSLGQVPHFVEKRRCNVLKTLFERCHARGATEEADLLLEAMVTAYGGDSKVLVPKLCDLDGELDEKKKGFQADEIKNKSALISHGCQLVIAMLGVPGAVSEAIQQSLLALSSEQLLKLATSNTSRILTSAFTTPSKLPAFHKRLVAGLSPHALELANSPAGQHVLNGIISAPSKGDGISVPFHIKENLMSKLSAHEKDLRESWTGRNVWRTWKGDIWNHKRAEWIRWAKEADPEAARKATMPKPKEGGTWEDRAKAAKGFKGANNLALGQKRKRDPAVAA